MTREQLIASIKRKRSLLCVGLDTEAHLVPDQFRAEGDPVEAFNRVIIGATRDLAVAYKLNLAFYEARGSEGWRSLERTLKEVPEDCLMIADAKRGDIGNTARKYAGAFFDKLGFDAVTVAPYMGHDSVRPFLGRPGKWAIVLAVTSNEGAMDFQFLPVDGGQHRLFEKVITRVSEWGTVNDTMFVVGATRPEVLARARQLAPAHFFLVPGIGAQGGDLDAVLAQGLNKDAGLLINSSRGILYAGKGPGAIDAAREEAGRLQRIMESALRAHGIL